MSSIYFNLIEINFKIGYYIFIKYQKGDVFVKNLLILRKNKHLRQVDVANYLGIAVSTYSYWENDINEPDVDSLKKLADFFDVSIDVLLDRADFSATSLSNAIQEAKQQWLSSLTKMQQSIIKNVLKLNELQQYKVQAYMFGMLEA